MDQPVLVTYSTWGGATHSIAEAIAEALRTSGRKVDVIEASEVRDLTAYRAVVIGAGVHAGYLHGDMAKFLKRHRLMLSQMPVAYFVVCMTMREDTPSNRQQAEAYLDRVRRQVPEIKPIAVGLFAGAVLTSGPDFERLPFPLKWVYRALAPLGDARNWEAIRAWAQHLDAQLTARLC